MLRKHGQRGTALVLASALLGGCSWVAPVFTTEADAGYGAPFLLPWSRSRSPVVLADSYTVQRLRGAAVGEQVESRLEVEPGNVWPAEEAPRATLANPDAALRGVPPYRPGEGRSIRDLPVDERPGGPLVPPRADSSPVEEQGPRAQRGRRGGTTSSPPPALAQPAPDRPEVLAVPPGAYSPPARRADGQVVIPPLGPPVVTSGGTDRVQGFTTPGGGSGVIHRDGGVTTIVPSGGIPQTFPTPR